MPLIQQPLFDFFNNKKDSTKGLNNRYKAFSTCPFAVLAVNTEGIILWHNNSFSKKIFSENTIDSTGTSFLGMTRKVVQYNFVDKWKRLIQLKEGNFTSELILLNNNQEKKYFDAAVSFNGRRHLLIILYDCTEERKKQETQRTNKEQYNLFSKATKAGLWDWDIEKNSVWLSSTLVSMLPEQAGAISSPKQLFDLIHPEERNRVTNQLTPNKLRKKDCVTEMRILSNNNTYRWMKLVTHIQYYKNHKPSHVIGAFTDIHKETTSGIELKESERQYRSILSSVSDILFRANPDGMLSFLSPAFERLTGYFPKVDEVWYLEDIIPKDTLHDIIYKLSHKKELTNYELYLNAPNASKSWLVSGNLREYITEGGKKAIEGTLRDISAIQKYRYELEKTHQSLLDAHKLARLGHWEYNLNKDELHLSQEIKKILQIEDDGFSQQDFLHSVLGEKADELIDKLRKERINSTSQKSYYPVLLEKLHLHTYVKAHHHADETTIIGVTQDITEQENTQKRIEDLLNIVKHRNKELRCLLRVTQLSASDLLTAEQVINETVKLIPDALRFSEHTACEIVITKVAYRSDHFFESVNKLEHTIRVDEKNVGAVTVYRSHLPEGTSTPFSIEEQNLIKALSFQLSGLIRRKREDQVRKAFMEQVMESEARYERLANSTKEGVIIHKDNSIVEFNASAAALFGYASEEFYKISIVTLLDTHSKEKAIAAIESNYDRPMEYTGIKKDGTSFPIEVSGKDLPYKGEHARVSIIRDLTIEKENQREINNLLQEVTDRNKELQCLLDLSSLSNSSDKSIDEILYDTLALIPPTWQHSDMCCARVVYASRTYSTPNFQTSPWCMSAPILSNEKEIGRVEVYYTEPSPEMDEGPFAKEERYLIDALGVQLGLMIEKKRQDEHLIASVLETADNERTRFAKELHDSLGQTLTAVAYNLNKFKTSIHQPSELRMDKFDQAMEYLHHGINETRTIAHHLMPKTLNDFGYLHATRALIKAFEDEQFTIRLLYNVSSDDVRLDPKIELSLYRITQESINNTIKHAEATEVTIQLMVYPDLIIWTYEDNGKGFSKKNYNLHNSFGLNGLYTRANAIGGTLMIDSSPGRGVLMSLEIPLNR